MTPRPSPVGKDWRKPDRARQPGKILPAPKSGASLLFKSMIISIWAAMVAIGIIFLQTKPESKNAEQASVEKTVSEHRTDTISIALFENGKVAGHLTTRIAYQVVDPIPSENAPPMNFIIEDVLHEAVYGTNSLSPKSDKSTLETAIIGQLQSALDRREGIPKIQNIKLDKTNFLLK